MTELERAEVERQRILGSSKASKRARKQSSFDRASSIYARKKLDDAVCKGKSEKSKTFAVIAIAESNSKQNRAREMQGQIQGNRKTCWRDQ